MVAKKKLELLAPAGNLEKLKTAIQYGADAVYVGVPGLSLRTKASEMTFEQIREGVKYAHDKGAKVYAALNIFPQNTDLSHVQETIQRLVNKNVDALIVSDPGILAMVKKIAPEMRVHLSTQANTTNIEAVKFWKDQGVSRIVLARELSLNEIAQIAQNVKGIEVEIFAHGAMCIAYSGRCMLSSYMASRSANRGECAQPCRWEYHLKESKRDEPLVIEEDQNGTYIMNSKDLSLIEHLPLIIESSINSIKIEGRMKSAYYVALVTSVYRQAIDSYYKNPDKYICDEAWIAELSKVSHRGYTTGFYFGQPNMTAHNYDTSKYTKDYEFVGMIASYSKKDSRIKVAVRNQILSNDEVEVLLPKQKKPYIIKPNKIEDESGKQLESVHNSYTAYFKVDKALPEGAVLRRKSRT